MLTMLEPMFTIIVEKTPMVGGHFMPDGDIVHRRLRRFYQKPMPRRSSRKAYVAEWDAVKSQISVGLLDWKNNRNTSDKR